VTPLKLILSPLKIGGYVMIPTALTSNSIVVDKPTAHAHQMLIEQRQLIACMGVDHPGLADAKRLLELLHYDAGLADFALPISQDAA
jgi:hypothetical protein